jgi:LemA protein
MAWAIAVLIVALALVGIGAGFGRAMWNRRWTMADTPRSDAAHVFVGTNEVVGRAVPLAQPLVAPFSGVEAVWFRSLLEKEVKSDQSTSWRKVSEESSSTPFWIEDDTGRVLVWPEHAAVDARDRRRSNHSGVPERFDRYSLMRQLADDRDPSMTDRAMAMITRAVEGRHRSTEWIIKPGESIYVLGDATLRDDVVALEFRPGRSADGRRRRLFVSAGDEVRAARNALWQGLLLLLVLFVGAIGVPVALYGMTYWSDAGPQPGDPDVIDAVGGWMVVAAVAVVAFLPVSYVVRLYNRLVDVRQRVEAAWSLIDVQLRRRHDLLPDLARVVGAAATYESTTQVALALGRSNLPDREALAGRSRLDQTERELARTLVARGEAHPELQVDENARQLFDQIRATEDAVAFARTFYNDAVTVMRDRRQRFPGSLMAWAVPVADVELWEPDEPDARPSAAPPPVDLSSDGAPS